MKFNYTYMPYSAANNIRKDIEKKRVRKINDIETENLQKGKNEIIYSTDIKDYDKKFKKNNDITFFSIGDNSYISFDISFVSKEQIDDDPQLFSLHLEHLTNIYNDVAEWFFDKFKKKPLSYSINADEDVPRLHLIFDNFREISQGRYKATSSTFFEFNRRIHDYEEFDGVKKITLKVKKRIVEKIKYEFYEKFGTIQFSKYLN